MASLVYSSLFHAYFIAYGDCPHASDRLVSCFSVRARLLRDPGLHKPVHELMRSLRRRAERKTIDTSDGHWISYDEYFGLKAEGVIDQIDGILAERFGFAAEERD